MTTRRPPPMKAPLRVLALIAVLSLTTACTTSQRPPWTYPPASPSGAPSAQPSGAPTAVPTAAPTTDGSVLPALTPKANLGPVPAGGGQTAPAPHRPPARARAHHN